MYKYYVNNSFPEDGESNGITIYRTKDNISFEGFSFHSHKWENPHDWESENSRFVVTSLKKIHPYDFIEQIKHLMRIIQIDSDDFISALKVTLLYDEIDV